MKLGLGLFTDLSPIDRLRVAPFATADVDFYGAHLGFLFSNREVHPERAEAEGDAKKGGGFSIAIGFRYSHGRGQGLGLSIPAQYDPSSITLEGTSGRINEIALNLGANVSF